MNTIYTSMHFIDVENNTTIYKDMSGSADAKNYVDVIMNETIENESKRKFKVSRETTEVVAHVLNSISNREVDTNGSNNIALRLLRVETEAQERINRLGKKIKKGSLIQSLFELNNDFYYILSKVDSDSYLDEAELEKRLGLRYEDKAFKNCLIKFTNQQISEIFISDTNSGGTEYWHNGFLELEEVLTNSKNTAHTFKAIEKVLKKELEDYPSELTLHRNLLVGYFQNRNSYDIDSCFEHTFGEEVNENIDFTSIKNKIRTKTINAGFDTQFQIERSAIKSRKWKETKPVNNFIEITLDGSDEYIKESVKSITEDSQKYLKIAVTNEETFEAFNWGD